MTAGPMSLVEWETDRWVSRGLPLSLWRAAEIQLWSFQKWIGTSADHQIGVHHGRRISSEEKAKFVASAWGTELIQFLGALAIFH